MNIITNNVPRDVIEAYELTPKEREEFDYYDWEKIEAGENSASFFRYKREIYDLGEFNTTAGYWWSEPNSPLRKWDGILNESFFSGILVRFVDMGERVVVGRYYS